ncbi:ClC family H(+)/Cl(-) exchange transporter [Pediococcus ethanolidurans]|uniref:ClC family H(+)/Cl(-) exchange transporter n=1 Tax=Pediococcus ethanolidurans TaxID=319653 RepID=UPI001C1F0293|nr:ClC family H(+)/Cl(-) exchange transporter [Pediococcus ethanolidurans]MBU7555790.1 chloride channel protein [Pediococcus ethanolidurans]
MQWQAQPTKKSSPDRTHLTYILQGCLTGAITGLVVSIFRLSIVNGLKLMLVVYKYLLMTPALIPVWLLLMLLVAIVVGYMGRQYPEIKGSGIPQVEGQLSGNLEYAWWPVLWRKFVGGILSNGSGLFLGREGPSMQLGATVAQGYAQATHQTELKRRVLIASGTAAGLSAAFNAPIASTLFVLEEVYHNFSPLIWTTALASAIVSSFVSTVFFGSTPVLHIVYARTLPLTMYPHLLLLGIFLGGMGFFYQRILLKMNDWYTYLTRLPNWLFGIVPFILIIPIGLYIPQLMGGGNNIILAIAAHSPTLIVLIGIFALRFIFSMISYGSGLPGGIFLPILSLGVILGAIYGKTMIQLGLMPSAYLVNFIIIAMAGYFAGIEKAPFTAILLITEMVGTLHHLMPLAVVSITAYIVVDILGGAPIYESLLHKIVQPTMPHAGGKLDRVEFPLFVGSYMVGHQVRDFQWPQNSLLIAIRRGEREIIPHGDTLLIAGDTLVVTTGHRNRGNLLHLLDRLPVQTK